MEALIAELEAATEGSRECVIWPRKLDKRGRGRIWHAGKLMLAHRWVWERLRGPIPSGKMLCHKCDNPACVLPSHLYIGTHADNMRDMSRRKRTHYHRNPEKVRAMGWRAGKMNTWARGEGNPKAKLTAQQAAEIKADTRKTKELAIIYDVCRTTIQRIRQGALWAL